MSDGEDWVMRPVLRGLCQYESLVSGRVNLLDIARMNEAIDVEDTNRQRLQAAANRK